MGKGKDWPAARPDLNKYCQIYRDVAKEHDLLIVDHYPNWIKLVEKDRDEFLKYVTDGVHPNLDGYRKILPP